MRVMSEYITQRIDVSASIVANILTNPNVWCTLDLYYNKKNRIEA